MAAEATDYLANVIAVAGTLMGGVIAGVIALAVTRRQIAWQKTDASQRNNLETERWAHSILEDREKLVWAERRALYARLLVAIDEWHRAIRHLAEITLPKDVIIESLEDARTASPPAAKAVTTMNTVTLLVQEVHVIGGMRVRAATVAVQQELFVAARNAVHNTKSNGDIYKLVHSLTAAMRTELLGYSKLAASTSRATAQPAPGADGIQESGPQTVPK